MVENTREEVPEPGRKFLLSEFEMAWEMVFRIDERRTKVVEFYSVLFAVVVGFTANILAGNRSKSSITPCIALLLAGVLIGFAVLVLLQSERKANVRYRTKINLIRGLLLKNSREHPAVVEYLEKKELGIKTYEDAEQPRGLGRTLRCVFVVVLLEVFFLLFFVGILIHSLRGSGSLLGSI